MPQAWKNVKNKTRTLERTRATIGEMNFSAQYQQRPAPAGGGMIKAAWLQRFRLADPLAFDRVVQSWDTANKPSELASLIPVANPDCLRPASPSRHAAECHEARQAGGFR